MMTLLKRLLPALLALLLLASCAVPAEPSDKTDTTPSTEAAGSLEETPAETPTQAPAAEAETPVESVTQPETEPPVTEAETEDPFLGSFLLTDRLPELAPEPLSLEEMYFLAEDIVAMGKAIGIEKNQMTNLFVARSFSQEESKADIVEVTEETYWLRSADGDPARKACVYAVFLAVVLNHQPQNVMDFDIDYNDSYNRHPYYTLLYSEDFREYGFDTIEAYRSSLLKQECAASSRTFYIDYNRISVTCYDKPWVELLDKWVRE